MWRWVILGFFIFFDPYVSQSQTVYPGQIIDGDTVAVIKLPAYEVNTKRKWKTRKEYNRYLKLQKKVVKVYPLAKLAAKKLDEYAVQLSQVKSDKEKKKFYKKIEQELKAEYEGQLRELTISEGRILIKLLDRETGNTSYQLVQELRGNFSAFFWQGMAKIFGHNLKSAYDPEAEDKEIEFIVRRIELGLISL